MKIKPGYKFILELGDRKLNKYEIVGTDLYVLIEMLEKLTPYVPPTDVQPVVRCKDCKYWHDAPAADGLNSCEMDALIRHEGFFCANGELKDGGQNG